VFHTCTNTMRLVSFIGPYLHEHHAPCFVHWSIPARTQCTTAFRSLVHTYMQMIYHRVSFIGLYVHADNLPPCTSL
jgi:hypothetical protein